MKVGIISAVENELAPILEIIESRRVSVKARLEVHEGWIDGVEVAAAVCGVCKVNAAMCAQILIDSYGAELIINAGTAGGMAAELGLFDTVISTEVGYHDVDFAFLRDYHPHFESAYFVTKPELLQFARKMASKISTGGRIHFGRMMTGEAFITDEGRPQINERYAPLSVDMETGAIAHVCQLNDVPFISIRSITDTADHSGIGEFEENCKKASAVSALVCSALLREIKISKKESVK